MSLNSPPCFRKTSPAVCDGLIPIPSSVMIALVAGGTLNSSAAYLMTAVNGVFSGTPRLRKQECIKIYQNVSKCIKITHDLTYLHFVWQLRIRCQCDLELNFHRRCGWCCCCFCPEISSITLDKSTHPNTYPNTLTSLLINPVPSCSQEQETSNQKS